MMCNGCALTQRKARVDDASSPTSNTEYETPSVSRSGFGLSGYTHAAGISCDEAATALGKYCKIWANAKDTSTATKNTYARFIESPYGIADGG